MGSRYDLTSDQGLKEQLLTVRRGTAFWHRKVEELDDQELEGPSLLEGWSRRHLIAHVGYNARAIARLVLWANTGTEHLMYASPEERTTEINLGATMPARALRHLNQHAAVSLNVEWRDTPEECWSQEVKTAHGRTVPLTETVWMRIREVWLHSVDLNNGAQLTDLPEQVLSDMLQDILNVWRSRGTDPGYAIAVEGHEELGTLGERDVVAALTVKGTLPAVVSWASGRGGAQLVEGSELLPPRWL